MTRERCLLDHAARVQAAISQRAGGAVAIDAAPATLARAAFG
jgi:hypothetical protein